MKKCVTRSVGRWWDFSSSYCPFCHFHCSFSGIVPCHYWWRIAGSPSVALYKVSNTHCDIWLGSRNEINFCQMLKATEVAKLFMFPPLCSLILEPDLDKGKEQKVQKLAEYEGGTSHSQLLWASENIDLQLSRSSGQISSKPLALTFHTLHGIWDRWITMIACFLLWLTEEIGSPCSRKDSIAGFPGLPGGSRSFCGQSCAVVNAHSILCSLEGVTFHDRALSPCFQVNRLRKDPPKCFAGLQ